MLKHLPAYALAHIYWALPLAAALSALFYPLRSRVDAYRLAFLVIFIVVSTGPCYSDLIRSGFWSYPPEAIGSHTLFDIPAGEYFFLVVHTYVTSLLYLLLGKPVFHPAYLATGEDRLRGLKLKWLGRAGMVLLAAAFGIAVVIVKEDKEGTYLGFIIACILPYLLLLWFLSYTHILSLPVANTLVPILAPTFYHWLVGTLALDRRIWDISTRSIYLWPHFKIEEAAFFLLMNTAIVFGQIVIDHSLAILTAFPDVFPVIPALPSPMLVVRAVITPTEAYDARRLSDMRDAVERLRAKDRSFIVASAVFEGRLRADFLILYSFFRVADDLIDDAPDAEAAAEALRSLHRFIELAYAPATSPGYNKGALEAYIRNTFPTNAQASLLLLPTNILPRQPLADMLEGFRADMLCAPGGNGATSGKGLFASEHDLVMYARRVTGSIGELCATLAIHHGRPTAASTEWATAGLKAAVTMGSALQLVNVARDVWVDARLEAGGRVYIPDAWLAEEGTSAAEVLDVARRVTHAGAPVQEQEEDEERDAEVCAAIQACRRRLIRGAETCFAASRPMIEELPTAWGARRGFRLVAEGYIEIGRELARRLDASGSGSDEARREWEGRAKKRGFRWKKAWTVWKTLAA